MISSGNPHRRPYGSLKKKKAKAAAKPKRRTVEERAIAQFWAEMATKDRAPFLGGWMLPDVGVEQRGEAPGKLFTHDAYGAMRRIAWQYRSTRDDEESAYLHVALQVLADRVKRRPGINPADVDHVVGCLMGGDKCFCSLCRGQY